MGYFLAIFESPFARDDDDDKCLLSLPYTMSSVKPTNTKMMPNHWRAATGCMKMITEPRMVKNFRVVVMMEHMSGPNVVTDMNTKIYNT